MRKAGAWLLAAVLSLTLCACGQKARPTVGLGRFSGEQVSVYGGDWQPVSEVYSGPTYLALNAGGEGVFCVDGEAAEVGWATSGGELTLTMGSARCEGTIDANTIEIGFFVITRSLASLLSSQRFSSVPSTANILMYAKVLASVKIIPP